MKRRRHATGSVATLVARAFAVAFTVAFAVAFTVVGCGKVSPSGTGGGGTGGGTGGGGTGGTTIDQACAMLAQTECAKRDSCSNGAAIKRAFGDLGTCMARATLLCADALRAPGTGNSPTLVPQCIADYATLACNDFFDGKLPDSCTPSGSVATGQPCGFNGQCQTAFCGNLKSSVCGTCAATPTVGSSCATSACDHGQTCLDATMLCAANGIFNAPCNAAMPCGSGLSCVMAASTVGGDAGTDGTCQKAISQLGAACGGTLPGCDGSLGFYCGGTNGARTCMTTTFAGNGQPCGGLSPTSFTQCTAGSCFSGTGMVTGAMMTGTCKADVTEGAACDSVLGPFCQMPSRCVTSGNGTAGLCMLANGICN